jgi:hypothetical protein
VIGYLWYYHWASLIDLESPIAKFTERLWLGFARSSCGTDVSCSDLLMYGERVVIKSPVSIWSTMIGESSQPSSGDLRWRKGSVMSDEDMKAELERLRSENAALKKGASDGIRMKVSEKGAVSVYGMGRFPVTLYKEQWLKLLNMSDEIRAFIAENEARLKAKD